MGKNTQTLVFDGTSSVVATKAGKIVHLLAIVQEGVGAQPSEFCVGTPASLAEPLATGTVLQGAAVRFRNMVAGGTIISLPVYIPLLKGTLMTWTDGTGGSGLLNVVIEYP